MDAGNGEVLFVLGVLTALVVVGILVHRAAFAPRPDNHSASLRSESAETAFDGVSTTASDGFSDGSSTTTFDAVFDGSSEGSSEGLSDSVSDTSFDSSSDIGTTND